MFLDNVKSRRLLPDGSYRRRRPNKGEEPFRAQEHLYRHAAAALERARAASGVTVEPVTLPDAKAQTSEASARRRGSLRTQHEEVLVRQERRLLGHDEARGLRLSEERLGGQAMVEGRADGGGALVIVDVRDPAARPQRAPQPAQVG